MSERMRIQEYSKRGIQWLRQRPPYTIDALNTNMLYWLNRPVLRWRDPNPEELQNNSEVIRCFITGHAVDHHLKPATETKPAQAPRFPDTDEAIDTAKTKIREALDTIAREAQEKNKRLELVFCSATTGMDLSALEWALDKMDEAKPGETSNITVRAFLGYEKETFIKDSVAIEDEIVPNKDPEKDPTILKGHTPEHQQMWRDIFQRLEDRGLVVEPEFRGRRRQRRNPEPPKGAPKGERFKDQEKEEFKRRYGTGGNAPKYFDELNYWMVRYLRKGDYALALWDGGLPFGRGGTVYALHAADKKIKDESHIRFINPEGIINPDKLVDENGQPREISMRRVKEIVSQRRKQS